MLANMSVTILYFAQLAELAGKTEEQLDSNDADIASVYKRLQEKYKFPHSFSAIQVAVNHQLVPKTTPLKVNDTLTFLPPMTGG